MQPDLLVVFLVPPGSLPPPVIKKTTPAPVIVTSPKPKEYMPIHVDDCVRTNTAMVDVIQHDRVVGKVVEVFRSDLVESRPIYIRVKFRGEPGATPFAFAEVVKVACVPNGWPKETWVRPSSGEEETGTTGGTGMTGGEESGMTGMEETGATGAQSMETGMSGSADSEIEHDHTGPTDSSTGITGATGSKEMDAQAATSITGAEDDLKQSIRYSQALRLDDDAVFASSGGTGSTGATGSTGGSSEELTSASNVMKKLIQKKIVDANLAARNSNDMLLIRRAEMHAFKMAVRYLQAARHRDAVFVRAIKTGTHVMGFSRIVDQVKGMKRTARAARNAFVTTLETVYTVPSEVHKYLKKLDDRTKSQLKLAHPPAAVAFNTDECKDAKRMFKLCPRGFGCTAVNGDCRKCADCDVEDVGTF